MLRYWREKEEKDFKFETFRCVRRLRRIDVSLPLRSQLNENRRFATTAFAAQGEETFRYHCVRRSRRRDVSLPLHLALKARRRFATSAFAPEGEETFRYHS